MHRSYWDVEVHAKHFQEQRWQESVRQRRIDEAMGVVANPFNLGMARLVSSVKAWLVSWRGRRSGALAGDAAAASSAMYENVLQTERRPWQGQPARMPQPYADMAVIARGPAAPVMEQPRVSSDC